jgi:hypothetical protein
MKHPIELSPKKEPIKTYADFWHWFRSEESGLADGVRNRSDIERGFFDKIIPALDELGGGYYVLAGLTDNDQVEIVFTADGNVAQFVFIEQLVAAAPALDGWLFTALKQPLSLEEFQIDMEGFSFSAQNMQFSARIDPDYPDEIAITMVHQDFTPEKEQLITNGVFIFLENWLGELNFATLVDQVRVAAAPDKDEALIPLEKLPAYLAWREKEFVEKYEGTRRDTANDQFSIFEGKAPDGGTMIAVMNADLLDWDSKASHPWLLTFAIPYNGEDNNGLPDEAAFAELDAIGNELAAQLHDYEGYLEIGRDTAEGLRSIYYACKDYHKPALVAKAVAARYKEGRAIEFAIAKDKYWQALRHFATAAS